MRLSFAIAIAATLAAPGCAFTRSEKATNVEDESSVATAPKIETKTEAQATIATTPLPPAEWDEPDEDAPRVAPVDTAPAPQKIQGGPKSPRKPRAAEARGTNPKLADAEAQFSKAMREQLDAAFVQAERLWADYLDRHVGLPGYEQAHYNLALCLYFQGRAKEAVPTLRSLVQNIDSDNRFGHLAVDARILLAESLLQAGDYEAAMALTYEVLPDTKAEKNAGLERRTHAVGVSGTPPDYIQKIRLYTLRGRIFGSLKNEPAAHAALAKSKALLEGATKAQIPADDKRRLTASWAWRQLEVLRLGCLAKVPAPERLSEAEFLAYADTHYECAAPARGLFCKILAAKDDQIHAQALVTYRDLVETPIHLRAHLPPPARTVLKPEQRTHYEREMRTLIERTVAERSKSYRDIESCRAFDVF